MNISNQNPSQHQQPTIVTTLASPSLPTSPPIVVTMTDNVRDAPKLSSKVGSRSSRSSTMNAMAVNSPSNTMIGAHSNPFSSVLQHLNNPPPTADHTLIRGTNQHPVNQPPVTTKAPPTNPYLRTSQPPGLSGTPSPASAVTSPVTTIVHHTTAAAAITVTAGIDTQPTLNMDSSTTNAPTTAPTNTAPSQTPAARPRDDAMDTTPMITTIVPPVTPAYTQPSQAHPNPTTNQANSTPTSTTPTAPATGTDSGDTRPVRHRAVNPFTRYRGPNTLTTGPDPNAMDLDTPLPPRVANPDDKYVGPAAQPPIVPLPRRAVYGRYTWKIQVPASQNPIEAFVSAVQEIWNVLVGSDPSIVIYPWAERDAMDESQALSDPQDCPRTMHEIRAYFERPFLTAEGRTLYLPVRLGHTLSVADLRQSTAHFFGLAVNKFRVGFWYQALQHEKLVEIGWLLGSTAFMSPERLALEIESRSKGAIQVGCRWKMIALQKYNKDLPKHLQYRAMHIEVRYEQESAALRYLGELFSGKRTTDFVMGTPMRLIPIISKTTGDNRAKCSKMRACQGTFTAECRSVRIYTVPSLDFRHPTADHFSIRDFILDVKVPARPQERLFLSCDHQQQDESVVVTFFVRHQDDAYMVAQNLLAYLRFTNLSRYSDGITSCFNLEERERADNCSWDPVTRNVITIADSQLAAITDDAVEDLFGFDPDVHQRIQLEMDAVTNAVTSGPQDTSGIIRPHGGDSVSTFRKRTRFDEDHSAGSASTPLTSTVPPSKRPSPTVTRTSVTRRSSAIRGDMSTQSDVTMETRMSSMEQSFMLFQESLLRIEQRLASAPNQGDSGAGRPL